MFTILICAFILTTSCLANPVTDPEYLRKYITDIQSQIDNTVMPCNDFGKYACGNLKFNEKYEYISTNFKELVNKYLTDYEKPKNDAEKLMTTFYLSCKNANNITTIFDQIDALKSVKIWPVTRDYSSEEIAKLLGYFTTLQFDGLLSINLNDLTQHNKILINLPDISVQNIAIALNKFGVSAEKRIETIEKVEKFVQQLGNIHPYFENKVNKSAELKDVTALKESIPNFDWNTYFTTFTNVYGLDMDDFSKKPVITRNLEILKKTIDLINETDSKTVANYIIWRYLDIFSYKIDCADLVQFFYPFIILKIIDNQSNDPNNFFLKGLQVLNNFEKSFSKLKSQINNPKSEKVNEFLKKKKDIYENYGNYLSGQYLLDIFSELKMNENSLYSNKVNMLHAMNKFKVKNADGNGFKNLIENLMSAVKNYAIMDYGAKPLLYNFIIENTNLWIKAISIDQTFQFGTISDKCMKYTNTEHYLENDFNQVYLNEHVGYDIALHDYLNYIDENKEELKKQTEILTQAGLDNTKLYMLALAQQKCSDYEEDNLNGDNLMSYFKHSKLFSETWGCTTGDEMNQVCDDSTFVPNFKKLNNFIIKV